MLKKSKGGLVWLEFEIFQKHPVKHAIFLRHGGCSLKPYAGLNLSCSVGDNPISVHKNRMNINEIMGVKDLIIPKLTHGTNVAKIIDYQSITADAVITDKKYLGLAITHADCQAAIIYDPVNHCLGNVHSGWRGSVNNIFAKTIKAMEKAFGSSPKDLQIGISPSLGPNRAEFIHYKKELPKSFWKYQTKENHFNFWEISLMQLKELGVSKEQIEVASLCTYENPSDYYSYRRDGICGRNATAARLL